MKHPDDRYTFDLLTSCATLTDTIRRMKRHGKPCRVVLGKGLRLTYAPGDYFAIARQQVTPSPDEILAVSKAAKWSELALDPRQARPNFIGNLHAVVWLLEKVAL